jgi:MFS family permease
MKSICEIHLVALVDILRRVSRAKNWAIALSGMIVMMTLGTIYSWSLFTQPLIASFGWSNTTTTWTFALAIFSLGIGAVIGGRWQDRVGPRRVALTGVLLWSAGNFLAGLGTMHLGAGWMYLTYGLIGGFGAGMGYVAPVAVVTKWFPGRRGLGSGMVVMGFGLGACIYNFIVKNIPSFADAARIAADYASARAVAPEALHSIHFGEEHVQAVMSVFLYSGILFALIAGVCAAMLENPPDTQAGTAEDAAAYTTAEMLRTPQFYLLWLMLFLNVTAGILVISNAVPIMQELTGMAPTLVVAVYGGVAVFNGLGRFFWGAVSDRIGRNQAFGLILGIQAVVFGILGGFHGLAAVAIAYAIVLLCFGGGFGTMPSFNADYFGTKYMGANYGALLTAWGAAGIAGPLFAAHVKDTTGLYSGALMPVAIMLLSAVLLPIVTRKPERLEPATVRAEPRTETATGFLGQPAWLTSTGFLDRGPEQHWWRE